MSPGPTEVIDVWYQYWHVPSTSPSYIVSPCLHLAPLSCRLSAFWWEKPSISPLSWALQGTIKTLPDTPSLRTGRLAHWSGFSRYILLFGKLSWDFRTEKGKMQNKPGPVWCQKERKCSKNVGDKTQDHRSQRERALSSQKGGIWAKNK